MNDLLIVPEEDRCLVVTEEERTIEIAAEIRIIEVTDMPLLNSKQHTAGDTKLWTVQYGRWLDNTANIEQIDVASSSADFTVSNEQILGTDITFFLSGGSVNERTTLTLTMTDSLGNIKHDTVFFTGVAA
jgi:hypothetical protein